MAPISPGDIWGAEKPRAHLLGCGVLAVHGGRWQTALGCCSQPPTLRAERERGFGDHQPLGELQGREDPCCWEGSYGCKVPGGGNTIRFGVPWVGQQVSGCGSCSWPQAPRQQLGHKARPRLCCPPWCCLEERPALSLPPPAPLWGPSRGGGLLRLGAAQCLRLLTRLQPMSDEDVLPLSSPAGARHLAGCSLEACGQGGLRRPHLKANTVPLLPLSPLGPTHPSAQACWL